MRCRGGPPRASRWLLFRYLFARRGMLASNAAEAGGFLRSSPELDRPDLQMTFMVGLKDNPRTLPRRHGFVLHVAVLRPATRGRLELASADPAVRPVMHPNFLQDRADVRTLICGLKEARRIISMPALARYSRRRNSALVPRSARDADLEAFIRANVATTYHPGGHLQDGTARDPMAVVDSRLRVHGITGLRVADASIMPNIIGGNTSAPSMMIGERAADFILEDSAGGSAKADRERSQPKWRRLMPEKAKLALKPWRHPPAQPLPRQAESCICYGIKDSIDHGRAAGDAGQRQGKPGKTVTTESGQGQAGFALARIGRRIPAGPGRPGL